MAIIVECNSCGKQYNAPDSMAGKRVKCKQCGQVFAIPTLTGEMPPDDQLSSLAELEKSFHDGQPAQGTIHAGVAQPPTPAKLPDDEEDIPFAPRPGAGRANARFRFPFAPEIDQYLPPALVIGGL